jgi:cell division protein FtsB
MIKKLAIVGGVLLIIVICYSLAKQAYDSLQVESRVDAETDKLLSLQKKNTELKKQLEGVNNPEFIESQARDRLNFSRPNETVVIISQNDINKILGTVPEKQSKALPNWQGWLRLFFK